ncbi:hypothetical protein, partial [Bacillus subtilis]|uniref:hypothetical protein n=1 Tax=Bacillus subtilis TaxID=1423 RepID=UPI001BDB9627
MCEGFVKSSGVNREGTGLDQRVRLVVVFVNKAVELRGGIDRGGENVVVCFICGGGKNGFWRKVYAEINMRKFVL